jgi:polysaccharide export outer membrane protein
MSMSIPRHRRLQLPCLLVICGSLCMAGCANRSALSDSTGRPDLPAKPVLITAALIADQRSARQQRGGDDLAALRTAPTPYTLGPGDLLAISVYKNADLTMSVPAAAAPGAVADEQNAAAQQGFLLNAAGAIQFPLVGELVLQGLTVAQARALLTERLAKYLQRPSVKLHVQAFRSQRIYVDGEVKQPGVQPINDLPMTVTEAINRAGGITAAGDQSQLWLLRDGQRYHIDLPLLVQQGQDPNRLLLRSGDVLRVTALDESKVFVSGEVVTPRALLMHSGRLSLNEAIGEAGGINPLSGDARRVFVVRRRQDTIELYQLDARDTGALALAESFELAPRDLVFIDATGLAHWHRTLSMIIPGALTSAVSAGKQ